VCGLVGIWERGSRGSPDLSIRIAQMADTLQHRGPDDSGVWTDSERGVALGFRRLSIVDLSPQGHQPMVSESGRFVIIFNGEVYNFMALRQELEGAGHRFRGHSDTEVMLAAIEEWGFEAAVKRFVGMFAFVLWDAKERTLSLVRDRLGIKPLYYGWMGDTFVCGSELKALRAHPNFRAEVDRGALTLFMRHNYIPAPYSIYQGIRQLEPGSILTIEASDTSLRTPIPYWSAKDVAERGVSEPFSGSDEEAVEALDGLLREAVGLRMIADVPLGAFLSGGVDSSTVVALMQAQSDRPVKTFSIGVDKAGYDEAQHAAAVAMHLGTDHTELYVTPSEARAVIPLLPAMYDEPFADSSQIPTFLVSRLARQHVTVSLSGDGGDELFCGYNRYFLANSIWRKVSHLPAGARKGLGRGITAVDVAHYDKLLGWMSPLTGSFGSMGTTGDKLHKLGEVLAVRNREELYLSMVSHWRWPEHVVVDGWEPPTALTDRSQWANLPDFNRGMMYLDTITYLPNDILTKVDRASMAVSLEARVPLLDHAMVEFAWRLPIGLKVRNGQGKWILRQVLYKYVPKELIERPKMGFGVPIDSWLRGPLREWAESLLDERRLRDEGYLQPAAVRALWREHLSGERNWQGRLWNILMFQAWLEQWGSSDTALKGSVGDTRGSISLTL
jgi:asparagine synthase (glutamine-hydrolysing)